MMIKKVVYYFEDENGKTLLTVLSPAAYDFILHHCHDYNMLMEYLTAINTKWEKTD